MKIEKIYKAISCDISDCNDRLTSRVETSSKDGIRVPANGKSMVRIIRQLSDFKCVVQCLWCGKEFDTYYCKIKDGRGKYCSKSCIGKANGAQRCIDKKGVLSNNIKRELNPNWQGGYLKACVICGNPFWLYPSRKTETCSVKCGYERAKLVRAGKLQSLGNRRKQYGNCRFWGKLREQILLRDNYVCQECNLSFVDNTGFLHVHHKQRLVEGGSNDPTNLITVCRSCHTYIHRFDKIR